MRLKEIARAKAKGRPCTKLPGVQSRPLLGLRFRVVGILEFRVGPCSLGLGSGSLASQKGHPFLGPRP